MYFGIIGGIGPASTVDYYNGIVAQYLQKRGSYPRLLIDSIDMNAMLDRFAEDDLNGASDIIVSSLERIKSAGVECAAIASNTPHIVFDRIKARSPLPIISIVDETCKYISEHGYKNVLVLGTAFTMRSGMYEATLREYGINAVTPSEADIQTIHGLIFPNLENGIVVPEDKWNMMALSERYIAKYSLNAVILGCTEIPLMIKENDLSVPAVSTTQIHIDAVTRVMVESS